MQQRHTNRRQYFEELADTSQKYFIPFLEQYYGRVEECRILEIGCGDGGNLLPFVRKGCHVTGVDISETRIRQAREFFAERHAEARLIHADIFELEEETGQFDIVLIHDVIEHISRKREFIAQALRFLTPGGMLYIAFPAWQMPFGGHQQICRNRFLSRWPYLHLLPRFLYRRCLVWGGEEKPVVDELLDIKSCRTTIEHFRNLIRQCNLTLVREEFYLINPHYETKFGLKPRKVPALFAGIPYLRNFYTTSCFYLLRQG
ncbi:MAG: class I SAM-dependent methyltransferase [Tannerellaceae bacterium]|nr:class I SAM-dependent methyltransferase [Tannerellaceae bacterium]